MSLTPEQIITAQKAEVANITVLSMQWEGVKKSFDAACFLGDKEEADRLRQQLHNILDMQLDSIHTQMMLARQQLGA